MPQAVLVPLPLPLRASPPSTLPASLGPDGGDLGVPPPGQGEGDPLLVVRALVDEEGVEGLGPLVPQRVPREGLEQGVVRTEETEISVLQLGVDRCHDVMRVGLSGVVDILDHGVDLRQTSLEDGASVEETDPVQHQLHRGVHKCVDV